MKWVPRVMQGAEEKMGVLTKSSARNSLKHDL